jgi:peptidoglycan/xylan/chitin deacetylase (PgdA/CDA1 family)
MTKNIQNLKTATSSMSLGVGVSSIVSMAHDLHGRILGEQLAFSPNEAETSRSGCVVFEFDDGYLEDLNNILPVFQAASKPFCCAIITVKVGTEGYMTWDNLATLDATGLVEFLGHNHDHDSWIGPGYTPNMTAEEYEADLLLARAAYLLHGLTVKHYVSPGHVNVTWSREIANRFFLSNRCYATTTLNLDVPNWNELWAVNGDGVSAATLKTYMAEAESKKRLLIIYHHGSDQTEADKIGELLTYADTIELDVLKMDEAYERFKPRVVTGNHAHGDSTDQGFIVLDNGDVRCGKIIATGSITLLNPSSDFQSITITYDAGKIVFTPYSADHFIEFGDSAGLVPYTDGTEYCGVNSREWKQNYSRDIGSVHAEVRHFSRYSIKGYVGAEAFYEFGSEGKSKGIQAYEFRHTDGCSLFLFMDLTHQSQEPADPAQGHSEVWFDTSGNFNFKSNVGGSIITGSVAAS